MNLKLGYINVLKIKFLIFCFLLLISCFSCLKEGVDYNIVQTGEVYRIDSANVLFTAKILNKKEKIIEYGYKWDIHPYTDKANYCLSVKGEPEGDYFESKISSSMKPGTEYFVRAYIRTAKTITFGKFVSFVAQKSESPYITGFYPDKTTWNDTLTITGKNLGYNKNDIKITSTDGSTVYNFVITSSSGDEIKTIIPANYPVTTFSLKIAVSGNLFVVQNVKLAPPLIYSFDPDTAGFNSIVTLKGKYFHKSGNTILKINGTTIDYQSVTNNSIIFKFPKSMPEGNSLFRVTVYGQIADSQGKFYNSAPVIDDFEPKSGNSGSVITIKGKFFVSGSTSVKLDGDPATIQSLNDTIIQFVVPNNIHGGLLNLMVTVDNKTTTAIQKFVRLAPVISSFTPVTAIYSDTISIYGQRFSAIPSENTVKLGSFQAEVLSATNNLLRVRVPVFDGVSNCFITVSVGDETSTSPEKFFISPPVILDFNPKTGTFLDTITINTLYLHPADSKISVTLGGITSFPVVRTGNILKVVVNPGYVSTGGLSGITVKSDVLSCTCNTGFQLITPVIDSISPFKSQFSELIKIYGKFLNPVAGNSSVRIPEALTIISASADSIILKVPKTVNGLHDLSYTTGGIIVVKNNALRISNPFTSITPYVINIQYLRFGSFSFSIGNKLYIGNGTRNTTTYTNIIEFNTTTNQWYNELRTSIPTTSYNYATGFSIGSKGYCLDGHKLYELVPLPWTWSDKKAFPGGNIKFQSVFILNGKAYLAAGLNSSSQPTDEFWEYDPALDSWTQKSNYPGGTMSRGIGFAIGNKGYVGLGGPDQQYIWEYDPDSDIWTEKCRIPDLVQNISDDRLAAVCFTINDKAYIGTGYSLSPSSRSFFDLYEFNPATNSWKIAAYIPLAKGIAFAHAFSSGNKGYILWGFDYYSDLDQNQLLWIMDSELLK